MSRGTVTNYTEDGGTRTVIGGELDVVSGGTFKIAGNDVGASLASGVTGISFAAAAGGANVCEVTITALGANGSAIAVPTTLNVWLSDAATGLALTGTAASGTVQAKAASGEDRLVKTAKKNLEVQTLATGIYILEITDTAKTGFYVCADIPSTGIPAVSSQLQTADYG